MAFPVVFHCIRTHGKLDCLRCAWIKLLTIRHLYLLDGPTATSKLPKHLAQMNTRTMACAMCKGASVRKCTILSGQISQSNGQYKAEVRLIHLIPNAKCQMHRTSDRTIVIELVVHRYNVIQSIIKIPAAKLQHYQKSSISIELQTIAQINYYVLLYCIQ